jgi:hypothetical protein
LTAGIIVVLAFAVIGVVTAGAFVADHVSSSSKPSAKQHGRTGTPVAVQVVTRARSRATAIVAEAQAASESIVARANTKAKSIVATAQRRLARASARPTQIPPQPTAIPTSPPAVAAPQPTLAPTAVLNGQATGPSRGVTAPPGVNLNGLPASWVVVGYNATFGSGPGSAGSITVTNRTGNTYSGVVTVVYARGGSARAAYSGLGPGQTEVLPLNGTRYGGGGYQIHVTAR